MKKKFFVMATIVILAVVTLLGVNLKAPNTLSMFLRNVEATASATPDDEAGGESYGVGYENDPVMCTLTETKSCTASDRFPVLNTPCNIGYDYTIEYAGIENSCRFTGGMRGCNYHPCIRKK